MTKIVEKYRTDATIAHDQIITELNKRTFVGDAMAAESASRKRSVLQCDIDQLEKDIKHYLPARGDAIRLVWESLRRLRLGLETVIVQEESHITY